MPSKPGTIPALQRLPDCQRDALIRWLSIDNMTYAVIRSRLKTEFGISTSLGSLSAFYHEVVLPRQWAEDRARRAAAPTAGRVLAEIKIQANPDHSVTLSVVGEPAMVRAQVLEDSNGRGIVQILAN